MNVVLISHTHNPEQVVAMAARQCYAKGFTVDSLTDQEKDEKLIRKVMASGHTSVLEHAVFSFAIEGVSRCLSHQLVRHRHASFSQQSQRYVEASEDFERVMPRSIYDSYFRLEVLELWDSAGRLYKEMVKAGIPAEDARYILPNAATTNIIMTMNARELLHVFNLRGCNRAQWEIRDLFNEILRLVKPIAPVIFENAGASCTNGPCPEGALGCGKIKE